MILDAFGNLREQSFEEIWFGRKYNKLRSSLLSGRPQQACIDCRYYGWEKVPASPPLPRFIALWGHVTRKARRIPADPVTISEEDLWRLVLRLGVPDPHGLFRDLIGGRQLIAGAFFSILDSNDLSDENFIARCYRKFLNRAPDQSGFEGYRNALSAGSISRLDLVSAFLSSEEFQTQIWSFNQGIEESRGMVAN
jgi:hypothetical protein